MFEIFNLANLTMNPQAVFPEIYQELWWYSGSSLSSGGVTALGTNFVGKGGTGLVASSSSAAKLYTHNSGWNPNTKFAFEITAWNANGYGALAELWDFTAGAAVSGSNVSAGSTSTATVYRSGQFTLTPGHVYGVTVATGNASYPASFCDASLIIFPPAGSVSPSLSSISLANPSGGTLKEAYIPLWVYSSGTASDGGNTLGSNFILKGGTGLTGSNQSSTTLITLSSNWSASQKFALEASIYSANSASTTQCELWDMTSGTAVSSSLVSTSATTATLVRSGSFTLTPGHKYGVSIGQTNTSYVGYLTKAHLVALGG